MWQAIVLTVQIILLVVGRLLFLQAKSDLNARAAETPVLSELKSLQSRIKQMLDEMKTISDSASRQLQAECDRAYRLIERLEAAASSKETAFAAVESPQVESVAPLAKVKFQPVATEERWNQVYILSDQGLSAAEIARAAGISQGEAEMVLALRPSQ